MVLKRKIYQKMLAWKNERKGTSALMLDGARRVGKSFLCEQLGKNEYRSMILIDFGHISKEMFNVFENDSADLDMFFAKIAAYYHTLLYKRESLIVFDEVQLFPKARQLLKYLVADGRYDYIETGSLLSLKQNVKNILIPSEEEHLDMFPLDFEEFLWALGDESTIDLTQSCFEQKKPLGQALHRKVMNDFRQYMLVGGMPQAVLEYLNNKDFAAVDQIKKRILTLYRNDISKYASGYESKVNAIFDALPGQLSKKEKHYKLSSITKEARLRSYEDAFMWLSDAMIVNPCFNATDPHIGLALSSDHTTQKVFMADTGLLVTHAFRDNKYTDNELYRAILLDTLHVNEGMLMENIVAQILRYNGHSLFFFSRVDTFNRQNMMEIDFLITVKNKICPVEVKSSVYKAHSSLDKFRRKYHGSIGDAYILYTGDVAIKDDVLHLPIYMAMYL
ncbi:MAG: AAA family ATPase [Dehalococcoidia bacterium]|nr:AAA family ATPase [Dehalococcoidia bacterium]